MRARTTFRGVIVGTAAMAAVFSGTTAQAAPSETEPTCSYPSVCFIHGGEVVDEYYHVSDWQYLPIPLRAPLRVVNTRHETVWIGDSKGGASCIQPESALDVPYGTIEAVRIDDSVECDLT
ncbi:hypothetical protein [Streptomyces flavofungini]|uniref:hypothetical protein n=1 Tax=Streptomyces flavofungini TaxID=68200 RepID=UPI0025AF793A|nr:hypothetical protein [Streptomyces flavofungini]WJV45374.1 hypothetical protein QUY26_07375 [Streptomyces flavofungini]